MSKSSVRQDKGEAVFRFLKAHLETGFTAQQIADEVPVIGPFGREFRREWRGIIRQARDIAKANGLFIPMAIQEDDLDRPGYMTQHLYRLTSSPAKAFMPSVKIALQSAGVKSLEQQHNNFMAAGAYAGMSESERLSAQARIKAQEAIRLLEEASIERDRALVVERAEHRAQLRKMAKGNAD